MTTAPSFSTWSPQLTPHTRPGADLVALADWLVGELAGRHPVAGLSRLRGTGYLVAPVPVELGGLGVSSVHDLVVASSRLARADGALAAEVADHLGAVLALVRRREAALASGDEAQATSLAAALGAITSATSAGFSPTSSPERALLAAATSLGVAEAAFARVAARCRAIDDQRSLMLAAACSADLVAARDMVATAAARLEEPSAPGDGVVRVQRSVAAAAGRVLDRARTVLEPAWRPGARHDDLFHVWSVRPATG